jgi:hypothetical protein
MVLVCLFLLKQLVYARKNANIGQPMDGANKVDDIAPETQVS